MAFQAVKQQQSTVEIAQDLPVSWIEAPIAAPVGATRPERYDLATALRIVKAMETSAVRAAVYEEIKAKNPVYRLVDALYVAVGKPFFQPLILFLYMVKCVASVGATGSASREAAAVSISNFPNEHRTIERVTALVPHIAVERLTTARSHIFAFGQIANLARFMRAAPRLWTFTRRLARTYSFMPAARIASALAFYVRFSDMFAQRPELGAAIVASNYSPEAVGMAAAAHVNGRRVVYSNHAPVPANGAVVPPVLADCALFYGEEITCTYSRRSRCLAEVAYIGQPGTSRAMEWSGQIETIGIFLTAGTKPDVLRSLIASIRLDLPEARIIVRQHPVTLLRTDFSSIGIDDPKVELTIGNPLDDEIAACDMVICGNSGVSMNVLSGARPVAYLSSLDALEFDANGFVASRLVMSVPWWTDDIYERLRGFYRAPGWVGVMRSYDASYLSDGEALKREAAQMLERHILIAKPGSNRGGTGLAEPRAA